jgi:hypothetical protein
MQKVINHYFLKYVNQNYGLSQYFRQFNQQIIEYFNQQVIKNSQQQISQPLSHLMIYDQLLIVQLKVIKYLLQVLQINRRY